MNSSTSTGTPSPAGTTNPWIQKTLMPQSAVKDDDTLPIAAIVCIGVGLYVLLMFAIFALIRCYCSKQCSNLRCVCGNKQDPCCSCMPFNEKYGSTLVKFITCSCIKCDNCCKGSEKKIDWFSIIVCDKCFGPGGCCECRQCDIECNMDCSIINCLCCTIYSGPPNSDRHSLRGGRHSRNSLRRTDNFRRTDSFDQNSNNFYDNGDPIKHPPLPSTDRSFISTNPDSSRTLISSISSGPGSEIDGRYSQRRVSSTPDVLPDFPSSRSTRSTSKSAVAPHNSQFFAPRNQVSMNGVQPMSGKKLSTKKKLTETKVQILSKSERGDESMRDTQRSDVSNSITQQRKLSNTEGRNSVRFSPDVTSSMQNPSQSSAQDLETNSRPNTSSSVASSNSLSATSEALLAQYQLMDADKLTPR